MSSDDDIITTFWTLYSQEEILDIGIMTALYEMKSLPQIVENKETELAMEKFQKLNEQFAMAVLLACRPYNLICCRTGCRLGQRGIFGTIDQLKFMLEKNFDGRHFWIKSQTDKNMNIDAMFFPATSEKVLSASELKESRAAK